MTEAVRYDAVPLRAVIDPQTGYLRDSPIVGRAGVQTYREPDGSIKREYRPPNVVFAPEALAMMRGIPIIDRHQGLVTSANIRQHAIGSVLSEGRQDGNALVADVVIHHVDPVIKGGRKHLSLAYGVHLDKTPGISPDGEAYDRSITGIAYYNHLAIDFSGRAGIAKLRLDSNDAISTDIQDADDDAAAVEPATASTGTVAATQGTPLMPDNFVSVRLDTGITYPAAPEVAFAFEAARNALAAERTRADAAAARADAAQAATAAADTRAREALALTATAEQRADTAEGERDAQAAIAAAAEAKAAAAAAEVEARVAATAEAAAAGARTRIQLEQNAAAVGVTIRQDASDQDVRLAVIAKLHPSTEDLSNRSEPYIQARYDVAIAELNQRRHAGAAQTMLAMAPVTVNVAPLNSARAARDAMIRAKSN